MISTRFESRRRRCPNYPTAKSESGTIEFKVTGSSIESVDVGLLPLWSDEIEDDDDADHKTYRVELSDTQSNTVTVQLKIANPIEFINFQIVDVQTLPLFNVASIPFSDKTRTLNPLRELNLSADLNGDGFAELSGLARNVGTISFFGKANLAQDNYLNPAQQRGQLAPIIQRSVPRASAAAWIAAISMATASMTSCPSEKRTLKGSPILSLPYGSAAKTLLTTRPPLSPQRNFQGRRPFCNTIGSPKPTVAAFW